MSYKHSFVLFLLDLYIIPIVMGKAGFIAIFAVVNDDNFFPLSFLSVTVNKMNFQYWNSRGKRA
jgi:hypothetical protein